LAVPISFQLSGGFAAPYPLTVDRFRNKQDLLAFGERRGDCVDDGL